MDKIHAENGSPDAFFSLVRSPLRFRLLMIRQLPAAYFSGLRLVFASKEQCSVGIPYKWFTRNPFRSTYFACLAMAGEMSTGILAMAHIYKREPAISMLVTGIEGKFYKKARGRTVFQCEEGEKIRNAVDEALATNEPRTVSVLSMGLNELNEPVAEFLVTWSFKAKAAKPA